LLLASGCNDSNLADPLSAVEILPPFVVPPQSNVNVTNPTLTITAREESIAQYNYSSARINTRECFAFKYGRLEARMRLPAGQGLSCRGCADLCGHDGFNRRKQLDSDPSAGCGEHADERAGILAGSGHTGAKKE